MAVRVRLTRVGSKKNPIWRVVVADQRSPRDGRFIETVGQYNPQTHPSTIVLDEERLQHWIARGAQPTGTVKQLMRAHAKGLSPEPAAQPAPAAAGPVAEPSTSEGSGPAAETPASSAGAPAPSAEAPAQARDAPAAAPEGPVNDTAEAAGPDLAEALEPAEPIGTAQPVGTVEPVETAQPVEIAEPVEIAAPVEIAEPVDAAESVPDTGQMDAPSAEGDEPAASDAEPDGKPVSE